MSRKFASLFAAIAIAATAIAPASADQLNKTVSITVTYADLDLSRPEGVKTLSVRLERAVKKVCGKTGRHTPMHLHSKINACQAQTLSEAVAAIDAPLLTARFQPTKSKQLAGL